MGIIDTALSGSYIPRVQQRPRLSLEATSRSGWIGGTKANVGIRHTRRGNLLYANAANLKAFRIPFAWLDGEEHGLETHILAARSLWDSL